MQKPKPVLKNETHKILLDFKIKTDQLIQIRRANLVIINKKQKNLHIVDFADHRVKIIENEKRGKYLNPA